MIDPAKMSTMFTGAQPVQTPEPQNVQQTAPVAQQVQPVVSSTAVASDAIVSPAPGSVIDDLEMLDSIVSEVAQSGVAPVVPQPDELSVQTEPVPQDSVIAPTFQQDPLHGVMPQAMVQSVISADTLNPPNPAPATAKEVFERPISPDAVVDANAAVVHVETEINPEIPVEVEAFLQRAEHHTDKLPQEVVIADGTNEQATTNYPTRPVIVLPITEADEKAGMSKSPRYSIRWLVEWSHKIIKMFAGKVVYRQEEE